MVAGAPDDERVVSQRVEERSDARVEPREAREEEARQPRLLKVPGRVEPARLQPRLRDGNRTLVGRVVPAVGTVVRHAEALAVIAAHEAERAQLEANAEVTKRVARDPATRRVIFRLRIVRDAAVREKPVKLRRVVPAPRAR